MTIENLEEKVVELEDREEQLLEVVRSERAETREAFQAWQTDGSQSNWRRFESASHLVERAEDRLNEVGSVRLAAIRNLELAKSEARK